jgi:hypothetical protein
MNSFALLWGKMLRSSLWVTQSKETRLVWITLLCLKDSNGQVQSSVVGLADDAKVSLDECKQALQILMAPDPDDTSKVEEGRRIREITGGWEVVNHDMYRFSTDEKREFWRQQKAEQRAKKTGKNGWKGKPENPIVTANRTRERRYVKLEGDGDQDGADKVAAENLPQPKTENT